MPPGWNIYDKYVLAAATAAERDRWAATLKPFAAVDRDDYGFEWQDAGLQVCHSMTQPLVELY